MISSVFFYIICASTVMMYGIGLSESVGLSVHPRSILAVIFKSLFCTLSATSLSYLLTCNLLVPRDLGELYPLFCVLIFLVISVFTEILIRITANISTTDWTISLLSVILSVNEGDTLLEALLVCAVCVISFFLFTLLLGNVRRRLGQVRSVFNVDCLMFVSVAIILLATFAWNASWLNIKG